MKTGRLLNRREYLDQTLRRYWASVKKAGPEECWIWQGHRCVPLKNGMQYGNFNIYDGKTVNYRAHRFAWMLANGSIPAEMVIMHKCDVPLCVNPNHLQLATRRENLQDMQDKGRVAKGESQGFSRLTENQIKEIRTSSQTYAVLANRFGVKPNTIYQIKTRRSWSWLN